MPVTVPWAMPEFCGSLKDGSVNLKNTTEGPNPQVERKLGAEMPTEGLGEQTDIVILVSRELCVECLQKLQTNGAAVTVEFMLSVPKLKPVPMGWST